MNRLHEKGDAHSIILVVIVAGIIGFLGWTFVSRFISKSVTSSTTQFVAREVTAPVEVPADSPKELLMRALQSANISDSRVSDSSLILRRSMPAYGFSAPSTPANTVTSMVTLPESEYTTRTTSLKKYFTDRKYAVVDNGKSGAGNSTNYDGDRFSCEYNDWGASHESRGNFKTLLISCASLQDIEKNAKEVKPFYDLLASDTSIDKTSIKMKPLDIKPSKTEGYHIYQGAATLSATKKNTPYVWFYQTPDSKWHFVYYGLGGLSCADVTNPDAAKAFAGQKCFETDGRQSSTL